MPPTDQMRTVGERYRLGERIGQGGMGEVFAAQDLRLDREVALKLLRADLAHQEGMRDRVLAEARLAARLAHPHVVAVLDTGEHDGRPYVVMERLSGRTLRDELAGGPLSPERVRDVGIQVLRALAAAHDLGIVHRDVKPGNVLDAGVGTWKVADFGIAKWIHADQTLTGTGELLGSPSYLAPERIAGEQAGPRSDLYAVGVLLYEALCGRRPFEGDDPFALAAAIREGDHRPPTTVRPDADRRIAAVIEHAMRVDPADRFANAGEMADALLGEDDTTARTQPLATSTAGRAELGETPATTTETVEMPAPEETALLPEGAVGTAPRSRHHARAIPMIVGGAILVLLVIVVIAVIALTGADVGGGRGGDPTLPPGLEDALRRLEEAVRP